MRFSASLQRKAEASMGGQHKKSLHDQLQKNRKIIELVNYALQVNN